MRSPRTSLFRDDASALKFESQDPPAASVSVWLLILLDLKMVRFGVALINLVR